LSLEIMSAWAVVTVLAATGIVIWRRDYLRRKSWLDIIPALVLAWIAANYTFLALTDGLGILFFVMFLSATPLWFILAISLLPPKKNSGF
jgi:cytochrome b subunit of formate dehydrogenase